MLGVALGLTDLVPRLLPTNSGEPVLSSGLDVGYKLLTWFSALAEGQRILIRSTTS